jgi:hypothetical protein
MSKKILTIGLELASDQVETLEFSSKASLLDWDIFLFRPDISNYYSYATSMYQGKSSLDDSSSFKLKESCEHWRREIKQAVEAGKTVITYLAPLQEVYIDTGQRNYSGTGRNQKTTRIVAPYDNYASIPFQLKPISATGSAMRLVPLGQEVLAPYWSEFGSLSEYKVLLAAETAGICLTTKTGEKPVGAIARSKTSAGTLVLLPDVDFYPEHFLKKEGKGQAWTEAAAQFAARLIGTVVALDKALHGTAEVTPEPAWASDPAFVLATEQTLRSELLDAERLVEEAQRKKEELQERLNGAGSSRGLLYEKGKPLEHAIIQALQTLGFTAAGYKEASSEFDVVFECSEGRLLGEAEGKDSKAVNVDKLRQLAMNIHEDLQREEVKAPAKGVLFGNGFRLEPPTSRPVQFTEKCTTAAESSSTALVSTSNLFLAVQYLSAHPDEDYAKRCRETILKGNGVVTLQEPPTRPTTPPSDATQ